MAIESTRYILCCNDTTVTTYKYRGLLTPAPTI